MNSEYKGPLAFALTPMSQEATDMLNEHEASISELRKLGKEMESATDDQLAAMLPAMHASMLHHRLDTSSLSSVIRTATQKLTESEPADG